jgi:hypothetical protein
VVHRALAKSDFRRHVVARSTETVSHVLPPRALSNSSASTAFMRHTGHGGLKRAAYVTMAKGGALAARP